MGILYVLEGVAGSGKSTIAENLRVSEDGAVVISSDEIREELFGSLSQEDNNRVFDLMFTRTIEALKEQKTVIYDATNLSRRKRAHLYREVKRLSPDSIVGIIVLFATLETLLERNRNREHYKKVPEEVIKKMYLNMQPPRDGVDCDFYLCEGEKYFDKTVFVSAFTTLESLLAKVEDEKAKAEISLCYAEHDTPFHLETIDEHIDLCIDKAKTKGMKTIAAFHDLGKGVAKDGGKYIGHENLSSMYYLNALWSSGKLDAVVPKGTDTVEVILGHMIHANDGKVTVKYQNRNHLKDSTVSLIEYFAKNIDGVCRKTKK